MIHDKFYNERRRKEREENKKLILEDFDNKIGKWYTREDDDFILEHLYTMSAKDIGYALGRTQTSIYARIYKLRKKGILSFYKSEKLENYANKLKKA